MGWICYEKSIPWPTKFILGMQLPATRSKLSGQVRISRSYQGHRVKVIVTGAIKARLYVASLCSLKQIMTVAESWVVFLRLNGNTWIVCIIFVLLTFRGLLKLVDRRGGTCPHCLRDNPATNSCPLQFSRPGTTADYRSTCIVRYVLKQRKYHGGRENGAKCALSNRNDNSNRSMCRQVLSVN